MDDNISFSVPIFADEEGYVGRECPEEECQGYFKIIPGKGFEGDNPLCHCPYCGKSKPKDQYWTRDQLEYVKSQIMREITNMLHAELKKSEFDFKPKGDFGIGVSLKVQKQRSVPIRYYQEKDLETEVVCDNCSCHYAVYGVYVLCPSCGQHNSFGILKKNHEIIRKTLDLSNIVEKEVSEHIIWNALEDCVSTFDSYGKEFCKTNAPKSTDEEKALSISFQNIENANKRVKSIFGIDMSEAVSEEDWHMVLIGFQKRHLVAHNTGVIDEQYMLRANDPTAELGRKISIPSEEVSEILRILETFGSYLISNI